VETEHFNLNLIH